jgi:serine protease AprX
MAGLSNPASNAFVLAVGASDSMGTAVGSDDTVAPFSTKNNLGCKNAGCKNPDLVAPGSHLQGLRVPGSYIDQTHPEGLIDSRYFRGSGASQATAITSGAAAVLLQKYPNATPDQIRKQIMRYAPALSGCGLQSCGAGELSLTAMLGKSLPSYVNTAAASTGTGTLEAARGSDHLTLNGVTLTGEQDIFGKPFNAAAMATLEAAGSSWSGGTWNGSTWSGSSWSGSTWSGSTWSGSSWSGSSWSGNTWSGNTWSGSTWSGSTWSGSSWSGSSWSGNTWSAGSWN